MSIAVQLLDMMGSKLHVESVYGQGTKDIPVVFLTSVSARKKVYSALGTNPAGYILKPPSEEKLFEPIEEVLENSDITI